jgi:tetratricopeptide (TPR) repeat protein
VPLALAGLPAQPVFVGREDELSRLAEALNPQRTAGASGPVVVSAVSGLAGVGKTALAVRAAHTVLAAGWFGGGVLFIDLHGYDPPERRVTAERALGELLGALGVAGERIPTGQDDRERLYRSVLAELAAQGKPVLVLADNASTADQVRPLLPGTPAHRVVVTSRHTLADLDGARLLDLDVLDSVQSVALLDEVLRAANPDDGRVAGARERAVELAVLCGHLPLALRITAARLAADPEQSMAEEVEALSATSGRLQALQFGDSLAVRASFDLSYQQLQPDQARLFRLLALNPGPQTSSHAAAALAQVSQPHAHRLLRQLQRAHLIRPGTVHGWWRFHDLLRLYATHLATEADPETERVAAVLRLFDYYLHTASVAMDLLAPHEKHRRPPIPVAATPGPALRDSAQAMAWLETERPNLIATAVHAVHAAHHGLPRHAGHLSTILFRHLDSHAYFDDALTLHSHALTATRYTGDRITQGRVLSNLGVVYWRLGRYDEAVEHHQQALAVACEVGDRTTQGRALTNLGLVYRRLGRYDEAVEHYQQALAIGRQLGDRTTQGSALNNLGLVCWRLGRYDEAVKYHQQALAVARELGDRITQARVLNNLGGVYQQLGRYDEAVEHHQQALAIGREIGVRTTQGFALSNLGDVYRRLGRYDEAVAHHRQALGIARDIGDRDLEVGVLNELGETTRAAGELSQAMGHYHEALRIAREIGERAEQARAHDGIGHAHRELGDQRQARHHWQQALDIYTDLGVPESTDVRAHLAALDDQPP